MEPKVQISHLSPTEYLLDVVERVIHIMDVEPTNLQQLFDAFVTIWMHIECTLTTLCNKDLKADL